MAKFTLQRFVSMIVFFILTFLFFYWLIVQGRDLAYFFAFSTSEAVSSDIVGLGNTLGGIPGKVDLSYVWQSVGFTGTVNAVYSLKFLTKILCVSQFSQQYRAFTTDCGSFFYPVNMPEMEKVDLISILFKKFFDVDNDLVNVNVQETRTGGVG